MQVIAHKRLQFIRAEVIEHPRTKELHRDVKESFVVSPSPLPQDVPDWLKEDDLFDIAVADGTIIPVAILANAKSNAGKEKQKPQQDNGLAGNGWGK